MSESDADPTIAKRQADLEERERAVERAEARVQAAIEAQKDSIRGRERELEEERARRRELAAEHSRRMSELGARERELERRDTVVARWLRELEGSDGLGADELRAHVQALHAQLHGLAESPTAVAATVQDAPAQDTAGIEQSLAEREKRLADRIASVTKRELALARGAAEARAQAPEPVPVPLPAPAQAAPAAAEPVTERQSRWNLFDLQRRLAEADPARVDSYDECRSTLVALREFADYNGNLPKTFDALIDEVFAELLDAV